MRDVMTDVITDVAFDERLPLRWKMKSSAHFTPVAVARRAAHLLAAGSGMAVLDVGSGAGKFCLIAAHELAGVQFVGVEQRVDLVRVAQRLANEWKLPNVRFVHGDAFALDWSPFDAFYFYNPFAEQLLESALVLDKSIALDPLNFEPLVDAVVERLASVRIGTRIVTYCGFGAAPPAGYELVLTESIGVDYVELWIKTRPS